MTQNQLKALALEIETNRQRLHYFNATGDWMRATETLKLLASQQALYFNETKSGLKMSQPERLFLVFSEQHLDGARLTLSEYRALTKSMSPMDRETHVAVEIDADLAGETEQALLVQDKNHKKTG